jgi:predicted N-formylglutamate amidohydrolase
MARGRVHLLLTCEHGGNAIPAAYRDLFRSRRRLLQSHRGLDIGARDAARYLQRQLGAPLICASVSRLLVDLNRSIGHPALFSEFTRALPEAERQTILCRHYMPYRALVAGWIAAQLRRGGRVMHVAVHSFTPVLNGKRRLADVGLLYDPASAAETRLCREWAAALAAQECAWTIRRNFPYRGTADGQTVDMRRRFGRARYLGIELELNQACLASGPRRAALMRDLAATLAHAAAVA